MNFTIYMILFVFFVLGFCYSYQRIEYIYYYDYLKPVDVYGVYRTYSLRYFKRNSETQTNFLEFSYNTRTFDKEGFLLAMGLYKDWNPNLFTYSSVALGTKTDYLPKVRMDHEFFYKIGSKKELVLDLGLSFIKYHNNYQDFSLLYGLTYYSIGWNFTYKTIDSNIKPGNTNSKTDIFSLGFGYEKKSWLYLTYNYGNQFYIANFYSVPFNFDSKFSFYQVNYRTWIKENKGIILEYNYLTLKNNYTKTGLVMGFFYEY